MGASIVTGMDASPVFEAGEHVLDAVSLPVEQWIVVVLDFAIALGGDAGLDPACGERLTEPARIISPVAEHHLGGRQGIDHHRSTLVIAGLAFTQAQQERSALPIAHGMERGRQPAPAAPDISG